MGQYDSPALADPFEDDLDMSDIREGLALADDALDLMDHALDTFDGDDIGPINVPTPPAKETPPAVMETEKIYGLAGTFALVQSPADGWMVDVFGRRISPLLFLGALGALYAAYKLMTPAPRRRRRR